MRADRFRSRPAVAGLESRTVPSPLAMAAVVRPLAVRAADGWDRGRFARERAKLTRRDYPNLGRDYEVLGPSSDRYNCIAHALGHHNRWVTPRTGPPGQRLAWADQVFAKVGFARLPGLDAGWSPGVQKVVLYGYTNRNGSIREVRHAALQRPDGTWTSKLGHWALIRHPDPASVSGPLYGRPIAVYARPA